MFVRLGISELGKGDGTSDSTIISCLRGGVEKNRGAVEKKGGGAEEDKAVPRMSEAVSGRGKRRVGREDGWEERENSRLFPLSLLMFHPNQRNPQFNLLNKWSREPRFPLFSS
jgi:hypothetical protein